MGTTNSTSTNSTHTPKLLPHGSNNGRGLSHSSRKAVPHISKLEREVRDGPKKGLIIKALLQKRSAPGLYCLTIFFARVKNRMDDKR